MPIALRHEPRVQVLEVRPHPAMVGNGGSAQQRGGRSAAGDCTRAVRARSRAAAVDRCRTLDRCRDCTLTGVAGRASGRPRVMPRPGWAPRHDPLSVRHPRRIEPAPLALYVTGELDPAIGSGSFVKMPQRVEGIRRLEQRFVWFARAAGLVVFELPLDMAPWTVDLGRATRLAHAHLVPARADGRRRAASRPRSGLTSWTPTVWLAKCGPIACGRRFRRPRCLRRCRYRRTACCSHSRPE